MKIKAVFVLLITCCINIARADFEGLPDFKFGQVVDLSRYEHHLDKSCRAFTITNATIVPFTTWKIVVSPISHKIHSIIASTNADSVVMAMAFRDGLIGVFSNSFNKAKCVKAAEDEFRIFGFDATGGLAKVALVVQNKHELGVRVSDIWELDRIEAERKEIIRQRMPKAGHRRFNGVFGIGFLHALPEDAFLESKKNGNRIYSLKFEKPFFGIKSCNISTTYKSRLVYSVMAQGYYETECDAKNAYKQLVDSLIKDYGILPDSNDSHEDHASFYYNPMPERNRTSEFTQTVTVDVHSINNEDDPKKRWEVFVWAMDFRGIDLDLAEQRKESER